MFARPFFIAWKAGNQNVPSGTCTGNVTAGDGVITSTKDVRRAISSSTFSEGMYLLHFRVFRQNKRKLKPLKKQRARRKKKDTQKFVLK